MIGTVSGPDRWRVRAKLFPVREPDGRCLDLISMLHRISSLGYESIREGERLYSMQYSAEQPLVIEILHPNLLPQLESLCGDAGIVVEVEA